MPHKEVAAPDGTATTQLAEAEHEFTASRRRAARRLPPLGCGCSDPLIHHCEDDEPTDVQVDAYVAVVEHLSQLGYPAAPRIPELRALWRRGPSERRLVSAVTTRWDVA